MAKLNRLILFLGLILAISCTKDPVPRSETANLKTTGASAADLLSDGKYTSMYLEIVYVAGNRPTDEAIDVLKNFLQSRVYKPNGINVDLREVSSSGKAPFSIEEIVDIEKTERSAYNQGDEIAVWIYFADGSHEDDSNEKVTLGSAFRNTSMVIYEKTIKNFAQKTGAPNRSIIEGATLNHEFGHLFGLVDLGITPVTDHEDQDGKGGHCKVDGCLMRSSLEFGSGVIDVLDGNSIPSLKDACIQDLRSVGGK